MYLTSKGYSHKNHWIIIECPIYGNILTQILEIVEEKPEPWRLHAKQCLADTNILLNSTNVIAALNENEGLIGFVWLSNPDLSILYPWEACSFIFHVYIKPKYRKLGFGSKGIELALALSKIHKSDGVLLATDNIYLKKRFYYNFGFRNVAANPYLMKINFKRKRESIGYYDNNTPALRSLNYHDLATVQSITAQTHWISNGENIIRSSETEIEQYFCKIINDKQTHQFIIRGLYLNKPYVSWIIEKNGLLTQRILYEKENIDDLKILSLKAQTVINQTL